MHFYNKVEIKLAIQKSNLYAGNVFCSFIKMENFCGGCSPCKYVQASDTDASCKLKLKIRNTTEDGDLESMKPQNFAGAESAGPSPKTVSNCKNWFCTCVLGIFEWRSFCDQRLSPICASNYNSNCCGSKWTTVYGLLQFYRRKFVCDLLFLNPPGAQIALGWNIANSILQFFLMKFNISCISMFIVKTK